VLYSDALLLLYEMADRDDERFQVAAARWHARFVLEAKLPLRDAESGDDPALSAARRGSPRRSPPPPAHGRARGTRDT
jgi:hypothetical protein